MWDITRTDGESPPESPRPRLLDGQAPPGLWDGLAAQVQSHGFRVVDVPDRDALNGANGVTDYTSYTVKVRADISDAARVKTLPHELGHITLDHRARSDQGLCCGIREVEAESVAAMITSAYGMDSTGYTVPYVAEWSTDVADRDPVEVVRSNGELVRKTALTILDKLPEPPTSDGALRCCGGRHSTATPGRMNVPLGRHSGRTPFPVSHLCKGVPTVTPNPVQDPSTGSDFELDQVRTGSDVATWLLQQSDAYAAQVATAPTPDEARGLRNVASTLEAYAAVLRDYPANPALAAKLTSLADGYLHPTEMRSRRFRITTDSPARTSATRSTNLPCT